VKALVGKNPPSAPFAAERWDVHAAALARSQPLDPGHRACNPCIGMVILKVSFGGRTADGSNAVAFQSYTTPVHEFSHI
jgi:hypothetical protein